MQSYSAIKRNELILKQQMNIKNHYGESKNPETKRAYTGRSNLDMNSIKDKTLVTECRTKAAWAGLRED